MAVSSAHDAGGPWLADFVVVDDVRMRTEQVDVFNDLDFDEELVARGSWATEGEVVVTGAGHGVSLSFEDWFSSVVALLINTWCHFRDWVTGGLHIGVQTCQMARRSLQAGFRNELPIGREFLGSAQRTGRLKGRQTIVAGVARFVVERSITFSTTLPSLLTMCPW
jgi:hypothetical protein